VPAHSRHEVVIRRREPGESAGGAAEEAGIDDFLDRSPWVLTRFTTPGYDRSSTWTCRVQAEVQGTDDARDHGKAKAKEADGEEGLPERTPLLIRVQARAARGERGETAAIKAAWTSHRKTVQIDCLKGVRVPIRVQSRAAIIDGRSGLSGSKAAGKCSIRCGTFPSDLRIILNRS